MAWWLSPDRYMAKACKLKSKSPNKRIKLMLRTRRLFKSPLALRDRFQLELLEKPGKLLYTTKL